MWRSPSSHKYIRNTSTCGTIPTEHLLNAGRRPQTSQMARNSLHTSVGQKKKEKTEDKRIGTGHAPLGGSCEGGKVSTYYEVPSLAETAGWVGGGEASDPCRRAQQQGCGGQSREILAQMIGANQHSPAQEACLLTRRDGRGLGAEARASEVRSQGEDWGWLREHSLKGLAHHS